MADADTSVLRYFRCVKITLIVIYSIGLAVLSILFILSIVGLAAINVDDVQTKEDRDARETIRFWLIITVIFTAIGSVFYIIGLYGVVKEHKCLMLTISIYQVINIFCSFMVYGLGSSIISIFVTTLIILYTYMIHQKK